ncbi:hotdog fold domain-containing protein [Ornithinimicrobium sufpigmenti]|uniref:hotdog fold domain-containing protein n=1 Tax=Ornithinimicrobium sufpigmenti TaxID=2508882 RepID=UPI001036D5FF|nr:MULTISPECIES: hotdog fold domain-containing protein [unclassified Ornithinimicrobium]
MARSPLRQVYAALADKPLGRHLFSAAVALTAPYFRTIRATVVSLERGRGVATMADRWGVRNHLGTVHAIAMCNLAELVAGTTIEMSLPESHRWIPKGMQVSYLAKARGRLTAVATLEDLTGLGDHEAREVLVAVDITDPEGQGVVRADITMWITPTTRARATQDA